MITRYRGGSTGRGELTSPQKKMGKKWKIEPQKPPSHILLVHTCPPSRLSPGSASPLKTIIRSKKKLTESHFQAVTYSIN